MMIQKPMIDPIIEEIHRTRREISERFGGDFTAMLDDARRRQEASGRPLWKPKATNKTMHPSSEAEHADNGKTTVAAG